MTVHQQTSKSNIVKESQPDTAELRRLAEAATPGPWTWWTSNSIKRLTGRDGADGGVLHAYTLRSEPGTADISIREEDMAFIEACNPATILALLKRLETLEQQSRMMPTATVAVEGTMVELGQSEDGSYDMAVSTGDRKVSVHGFDKESSLLLAQGLFGAVQVAVTLEKPGDHQDADGTDSRVNSSQLEWIVTMISRMAGVEPAPELERRLRQVIVSELLKVGMSLKLEQLLDAMDRVPELQAFSDKLRKGSSLARETFNLIFGQKRDGGGRD